MTSTSQEGPSEQVEYCSTCDRRTRHDVRIEIVTENTAADHHEFSREPYRVATCRRCRSDSTQRMNNA